VTVRLHVWGVTDADIEHAVYKAGQRPSGGAWDLAEVERIQGVPCPIDVRDPGALAGDAGYHWAWVVYPAQGTPLGGAR
jgi:hypothetical protein